METKLPWLGRACLASLFVVGLKFLPRTAGGEAFPLLFCLSLCGLKTHISCCKATLVGCARDGTVHSKSKCANVGRVLRSHGGEGRALQLIFTCVKHECAKPRIPLIHSPFYLGPGIKSDHYLVKAIMRNKHLFSTAVGKLLSLAPGDLEVTAMRQSKSWAGNLITRETGLFGTEQQLAAVVAHGCVHGPGAERALVTQCTTQKCSMSSSCVHLITLRFCSCGQSWLFTPSFPTSHEELSKWIGISPWTQKASAQSCIFGFQDPFCFVVSNRMHACLGTQNKSQRSHP